MAVCKVNVATDRCSLKGTSDPGACEMNVATNRCKRKTERKKTRLTKPKPKIKTKPKTKPKTKAYKACAIGKVRNPKTNRCILRKNLTTQQLSVKDPAPKAPSPKAPAPKDKSKDDPEITTIGGAVSIAYYEINTSYVVKGQRQVVKKHILLLGDQHTPYGYTEQDHVIPVPDLVKNIINGSPHCIDLFVERVVTQRDSHRYAKGKGTGTGKGTGKGKRLADYPSPLEAMYVKFQQCPDHDRKGAKCPWENLRYQNWDLRFDSAGSTRSVLSNPYDEILMNISIHRELVKAFDPDDVIQYLLGFPISKAVSDDIDEFFDRKFAIKSAKSHAFRSGTTSKSFQTYHKKVIQKTYKKMMKDIKFPRDFLETFLRMFSTSYTKKYDYTHVFTDFYLLCRMFQKFGTGTKKKGRTPKRCPISPDGPGTKVPTNNYNTPKYIIVYAGDAHIDKLKDFFSRMYPLASPLYSSHRGSHYTKKLTLKNIGFTESFPEPTTIDGLFAPFYK